MFVQVLRRANISGGIDLGGAERAATWTRAAPRQLARRQGAARRRLDQKALSLRANVSGEESGTHPTRTDYASLPGAAATGGANSPERRTWLFECLASVVHRIFTAIATRARQVSETV